MLEPALGLFCLNQLFSVCRCAHELPGELSSQKQSIALVPKFIEEGVEVAGV